MACVRQFACQQNCLDRRPTDVEPGNCSGDLHGFERDSEMPLQGSCSRITNADSTPRLHQSQTARATSALTLRKSSLNAELYSARQVFRSEEHTSELQSRRDLVCRLLLEKKKKNKIKPNIQNNTYT